MGIIGKSSRNAIRNRFLYVASGSETSLSGADSNGASLLFTDGHYVDVYLNGVMLKNGVDYNTTTTNTISGLASLTASDEVTIIVYDTFNIASSGDLSATNLTSGTIPDSRFPATLPALNGSNLTNLDASDLTGSLPAIDGSNLTGLGGGSPSGSVIQYAGTSEPTGWLFCYGQAISRTTYSDLFSAISITYGTGDGTSTFNVPDIRGRVVAGQDDMGSSSANRLTSPINGDTLGATGGVESVSGSSSSHSHPFSDAYNYTYTGYRSGTTSSTSLTYLGSANVIQPTIVLNYIIKT